jgi:hypothetical protein
MLMPVTVDVAMTDEDVAHLMAISRSRTEPASRVERAQMLLAYREKPSFFAVGQRLGVQTKLTTARWGPRTAYDRYPVIHTGSYKLAEAG